MNQEREYLKTKIMTASKEQLLLMLFDGALRFSREAKIRMEAKDYEASNKLLLKSQNIMLELIQSLDREALGGEVYDNLERLYRFVYTRILRANMNRDMAMLDEAIVILAHLGETWGLAIENDQKGQVAELAGVARTFLPKEEDAEPESGLDLQG